MFYTSATVPSWSPSDAPFVWDTTATSVTLGWPEPAANGGTVTGYEVRADTSRVAGRSRGVDDGWLHAVRDSFAACMLELSAQAAPSRQAA